MVGPHATSLTQHVRQLKNTWQDLALCGSAPLLAIERVYQLLCGSSTRDIARDLADNLVRLADDRIRSYNYKEVPTHWRRLYTDAALLRAVTEMQAVFQTQPSDHFRSMIRDLDLVLIIAGAPGQDRNSITQALISLAQESFASGHEHGEAESGPPKKRQKVSKERRCDAPHVTRHIPALNAFPDFDEYLGDVFRSPFVVKGGCRDWPAHARWKDKQYLESAAGPARVVPVETGSSYTSQDWGQRIMPFDTLLDAVYADERPGPDDEKLYLAQHNLFHQMPQLEEDVTIPDLVYSSPPEPSDYPEYKAPSNGPGYILNAWLGPEATVSPAHTDPFYNCYAQVVGSKWVWMAPPSVSAYMQAFGSPVNQSSPTPACDPTREDADSVDENDNATTHLMTNTSQLDVTLTPSHRALQSNDSFVTQVEPVSMQAVLEAGDVLVMPPGWWHSFKSLEPSFSVSIWY